MGYKIAALALTAAWGCFLSVCLLRAQQSKPPKQITEDEIKRAINRSSDVDQCQTLDQIHINHLEYYDFNGDGQQEAIVVASTCMTGTAGPDVHAIFTREAGGKIIELPFLDAKGDPPISNQQGKKIPVFGNPNYTLRVESGKLVAHWSDSSDREQPVVVWYRWDGSNFLVDHAKIQGPYIPSYDCAKAQKEMDRAICYSPRIAALDLELGRVYGETLHKVSAEKIQELRMRQRQWLASREKTCTIYKWWVECLNELYTKRIADLRRALPSAAPVDSRK